MTLDFGSKVSVFIDEFCGAQHLVPPRDVNKFQSGQQNPAVKAHLCGFTARLRLRFPAYNINRDSTESLG